MDTLKRIEDGKEFAFVYDEVTNLAAQFQSGLEMVGSSLGRDLSAAGVSGVGPMRIFFATDQFLPHAGGSRVYYYNLYKNLSAEFGDRIILLTKKVAGWQDFDQQEGTHSFKIVRRFRPVLTTKYRDLPKMVLPVPDMLWILLKERVDVLHAGDLFPQGLISLALKRALGIPYLMYCHGEIAQTNCYRYKPVVRDWIYKQADAVVANSEFTRQDLLRVGVRSERIFKITPGVDCERFSPRPPDRNLIEKFRLEDKQVLLTVARLCPRKGHDVVMQAVARLSRDFPKLRYLVVGKGPEEKNLRRLAAELGIADIVTFVGYVAEEQLASWYNVCDIFVMPNRADGKDGDIEGFGMVFLEANSAGKPVIGGRSGGAAEAVADESTGFLVDPESVEDTVTKLRLLLLSPSLRAEMGERGLLRARGEFNWRVRSRLLRQITADIVRRRRTTSNGC